MNPVRVQRSRQHKQESPNDLPIVYVGRPSKWGNPYPKSVYGQEKAMEMYLAYVKAHRGELNLEYLKGKNLSCWCSLDKPCHADILLAVANSKPTPLINLKDFKI